MRHSELVESINFMLQVYNSDVRIVFFFSFRIESNIGLLFEISNRIE